LPQLLLLLLGEFLPVVFLARPPRRGLAPPTVAIAAVTAVTAFTVAADHLDPLSDQGLDLVRPHVSVRSHQITAVVSQAPTALCE
jgi:hypothetical protein